MLDKCNEPDKLDKENEEKQMKSQTTVYTRIRLEWNAYQNLSNAMQKKSNHLQIDEIKTMIVGWTQNVSLP